MTSKNVLEINDNNFATEVLGSKEPFLLDFGATWCAPCKALSPIVAALADSTVGQTRVGEIDIDDSPEVALKYKVRSAPTLIVFKNGVEVARHVGTCGKDKLLSLLGGA